MTASSSTQQFLAFDWGKLRVGVASGNTLTKSAQSVATLTQQGVARDQAILKLVKEWRPCALVVGVPYHPDGAPHRNTKLAKQFAQNLRGLTGALVYEVDERYSTTEAKADNPRAREAKLDALSACIILEQYMRSLPE
jgi:putative Holliday junction resolvase